MSEHDPNNADVGLDRPVVEQIFGWLEAHGIERRLVPANPRASLSDGQLTMQLWVSGPNGRGVKIDPQRPGEPMRETVTVTVTPPSSPLVEKWLASACPTCGR